MVKLIVGFRCFMVKMGKIKRESKELVMKMEIWTRWIVKQLQFLKELRIKLVLLISYNVESKD